MLDDTPSNNTVRVESETENDIPMESIKSGTGYQESLSFRNKVLQVRGLILVAKWAGRLCMFTAQVWERCPRLDNKTVFLNIFRS